LVQLVPRDRPRTVLVEVVEGPSDGVDTLCLHALGDLPDYALSGLGAVDDPLLDVGLDSLDGLVCDFAAFHGCEPGDLQQRVEVALAHLQLIHNEPRESLLLDLPRVPVGNALQPLPEAAALLALDRVQHPHDSFVVLQVDGVFVATLDALLLR